MTTGAGRDWSTMTRETFDTAAEDPGLFELTLGNVPAPVDPVGTGDLFELLPGDQ